MKKSIFTLFGTTTMVALITVACRTETVDPALEPQFVADNTTFVDFKNWSLDANRQGPDPSLGPAHGGNDSTVVRNIYYRDRQDPVDGTYPKGTVIVKMSQNPSIAVNEYTGIVKRGGTYNSGGGAWECFVLNEDGTIKEDNGMELRGSTDLFNGMCMSCHAKASSSDSIFTK